MQLSINFLHQHRRKLSALEEKDKTWYAYALRGAISIAVITACAVGVTVYVQYSVNTVLATKKNLESAILQQEDVERSILVLSSKVRILDELIDQRSDKQAAITYFTELFDESILIRDIDYQAGNGSLSLRIEAPSIFAFEEVVALLSSEQTQQQFTALRQSDLSRGRNGSYSLVLTVTLSTGIVESEDDDLGDIDGADELDLMEDMEGLDQNFNQGAVE